MQADLNVQYAGYLKNLSIPAFNPMQEELIETTGASTNVMLLAPTGSGKTLAFLIAIIARLRPEHKGVQAVVVAPSRELSLQIEQVFRSMKTAWKVSCCYGGHSVKVEENSLSESPALVIGTPGRLADHILRKTLDLSFVRIIVLDEFDKSLQMGFHDPLKVIFRSLGRHQHHVLTSATDLTVWPDFLPFKDPVTVRYLTEESATPRLQFRLVKTLSATKPETLMRLIAGFNQEVCLVFCNHREAVERISFLFSSHHFEHGILHGAMEQIDREKNMIKFRGAAHNVLIATDLASRGLDVPEIRHVVHYQLPPQEEAFTHRNGRTARMHASGIVYLVQAEDEVLPPYIDPATPEVKITEKLVLPSPPEFACLYISAGKKDKISKGDVVGLLTKKGGLTGDDVGLITTLDHSSYVSVRRSMVTKVLRNIKDERLKKQKVKIEVAS
jgi:superfamily II DNA/RNA helicase